jgi:uncharacterized OB-fold protein
MADEMSDERPPRLLPAPVGLNAEFYAHAAQGSLCFQRCDDCGAWRHPPRFLCATCGSERFTWTPSSGRGKVFSWTVTHRPIDPSFELPYAVLVVEMEEGVRVVGNLTALRPDELRLDRPVVVELEKMTDTIALLTFRPA